MRCSTPLQVCLAQPQPQVVLARAFINADQKSWQRDCEVGSNSCINALEDSVGTEVCPANPASCPRFVALIPVLELRGGQGSVITDYCRKATQQGKRGCFWMCYPDLTDRRRYAAKDVNVTRNDAEELAVDFDFASLATCHGWWKRFSLYSAMGVKEVQVRPLSCGCRHRLSTVL